MSRFLEFGNRSNTFNIEVRPTSKCNYACYYCTSNRNNNNPIIKLNSDNIKRIITSAKHYTRKSVYMYIVGGEPTMYPHLTELLNAVSEVLSHDDKIEIQTNLSKPLKWFRGVTSSINKIEHISFSASYHNTQCTNLTQFIDNCQYLTEIDMLDTITVMYNKRDNVTQAFNLLERLFPGMVELSFLVEPTLSKLTVNDNETLSESVTDEVEYIATNEDIDQLKKISPWYFSEDIPYVTSTSSGKISRFDLWLKKDNNFAGHECHLAKDMIFINWNGDCYKCPNDQWSDVPPVMNIQSTDFDSSVYFKDVAVRVCPYSWCCPHGVAEYKKGPCVDQNIDRIKCYEHNK